MSTSANFLKLTENLIFGNEKVRVPNQNILNKNWHFAGEEEQGVCGEKAGTENSCKPHTKLFGTQLLTGISRVLEMLGS